MGRSKILPTRHRIIYIPGIYIRADIHLSVSVCITRKVAAFARSEYPTRLAKTTKSSISWLTFFHFVYQHTSLGPTEFFFFFFFLSYCIVSHWSWSSRQRGVTNKRQAIVLRVWAWCAAPTIPMYSGVCTTVVRTEMSRRGLPQQQSRHFGCVRRNVSHPLVAEKIDTGIVHPSMDYLARNLPTWYHGMVCTWYRYIMYHIFVSYRVWSHRRPFRQGSPESGV